MNETRVLCPEFLCR